MKRTITNTTVDLNGQITTTLVEEDVPVPYEVTNFQARAALMASGQFTLVDTAIKAVGGVALQAWEYANNITRNGALVNSMAVSLGLTEEELDNLFIEASNIEA